MRQLRSWHLSTLKVVSEPMSALARTSESDCRTRTTGENCTASESWTRTKYTYDSLGNVRTAQLNCCQLKTINYSATTEYAYPDSVVSGSSSPQLTNSATYDLHMGLTLTTTDPNSVTTTMTYDNLGRTLTAKVGTNPATNYTYNDYNNSTSFTPWTVQVCSPIQGTNTACRKKILDSQGRTVTAQVLDGSSNLYSAADTQYDVFGRAYKASNPYKTGSGSNWTQIGFDVLGRTVTTTLPDNSVSSISYTDNTVTTTDPAGKQRMAISDGLGRLTSVKEPDPLNSNTLTLITSYTYNVSGQLLTVTNPAQTRTNVYDALGRLVSVTTPEGGTVCYGTYSGSTCQANGYDFYNNLTYRTDARGVVTNYLYDDLNRLVGISYPTVPSGVSPMPNVCKVNGASSNNANVCYTYGTTATGYQNGRVISINDPSGSESYTYDQFGDVTQLAKIIGTNTYTTNYTFNLASELTQITYPSGRVVQQSVDAIGRLCEIAPSTTGCGTAASPFATGFGYSAANEVTGFKYGNGIFASFGFSSDRLQLNCLDYSTTNRGTTCTHDSTTKFGLGYSYQTAPSNNGQISGITDSVDSGRNATYTYDSLYRLTNTSTAGSANYPAWGLSETYDRYGNRSVQGVSSGCTGITCPTNSVTINAATNQISGSPIAYDLAGNMTNDGLNTLVYDGENRAASATVTGSSSGTYTYDGKGLRVQKVSVVSGTSTTTVYVFSNSKVIAEYDNGALPSAPTREYIYAGAKLLTKIDTTGTKYYHQDHLSNRLVTDSNGNTVTQIGHFPFGESWYNATKDKLLFTSYERDAESGNDYAKARYYISRLARFSTPDPVAGNPSNPQSWNRYSYVLNDPINLNDPEGEYCQWDDGTTDDEPEGGGASQDECYAQGGTWIDGGSGDGSDDGSNGGQCDANCQVQQVVQQAMDDCVDSLYGVEMTQYLPPSSTQNGLFVGTGPNVFEGGGDQILAVVINTRNSFEQLGPICNPGGTNESGAEVSGAPGCIRPEDFPGTGNYQAFGTTIPGISYAASPAFTLFTTTVGELGNALDLLTGTQTWDEMAAQDATRRDAPTNDPFGFVGNNSPGLALAQCVYNHGGAPTGGQ